MFAVTVSNKFFDAFFRLMPDDQTAKSVNPMTTGAVNNLLRHNFSMFSSR